MNRDTQEIHLALGEKIKESAVSVIPIVIIVSVLCLSIVPMRPDFLLCFFLGAVMMIFGMGFFSLGADLSMTPIGNKVGTALTKTKNLPLILIVSFLLGFAVTVAEPDLQVLAATVPHIGNMALLISVGVGVGFFLSVCMLRILTGFRLRYLLLIFYALLFVLAYFSDKGYLSIAFDSGGVTTGPMTVPFILAMGMGVSNIRSDRNAESDSFGLVALCSVGPILAVLILGFFYPGSDAVADMSSSSFETTSQIGRAYLHAVPVYMKEIALSLLPIVVIFVLFQIFSLKLPRIRLIKIFVGILYTYIGLVLFLVGVNVGFSSLGVMLGSELATGWTRWLLIPLAMLLGWFIISAEPAVAVLQKQIEEVSAGAISGTAVKYSLSAAVALALALSMVRVLTGIPIMYFFVPGYFVALALSFAVPDIYTAIAFDSGGVASGPITSTFILQFAMGACTAIGGNVLTDAFGVVAMVAMMPLISIQIVGVVSTLKNRAVPAGEKKTYGNDEIIELWEEAV